MGMRPGHGGLVNAMTNMGELVFDNCVKRIKSVCISYNNLGEKFKPLKLVVSPMPMTLGKLIVYFVPIFTLFVR